VWEKKVGLAAGPLWADHPGPGPKTNIFFYF
jgi:hypothetical protein